MPVYLRIDEAIGKNWAQQEMVDAQAGIARKPTAPRRAAPQAPDTKTLSCRLKHSQNCEAGAAFAVSGDTGAACNPAHFAGDIAALERGEQNVDRREFDTLTRAAEAAGLAELGDFLLRLAAGRLQHCSDRSRRNLVSSEAPFHQLFCPRPGMRDDVRPGRRIVT